ncbi:prefoldin subunit 3-like isoform X2 [Dysidea avara]|uniref:prefoldin subunit 3-like isoform X2 n=1 Tax=Dysidea avara TaxID=196820 RepID=UPI0033204259
MAEEKQEKREEKENRKPHSGIPEAIFLEDVDSFMSKPENESGAAVLQKLDEQLNKYRFMDANLQQKKKRLTTQIPDIKKTLDTVQFLKSRQGSDESFTSNYLLSDNMYTTAEIKPSSVVYLWLGANVMMEYSIDEACSLLTKNLASAKKTLAQVQEDLNFIRDQTTTTEVNMARVYNWDVKQRRTANKTSGIK